MQLDFVRIRSDLGVNIFTIFNREKKHWFTSINYCSSGCTTIEALEAATLHPAQLLNIESSKGTLDYNSAADFIFLTDDLKVQATFIAGIPVYVNNDDIQKELQSNQYL